MTPRTRWWREPALHFVLLGAGVFATLRATGLPLQRRDDGWPEQDCLIDWLQAHARCAEITADALQAGNLGLAQEQLQTAAGQMDEARGSAASAGVDSCESALGDMTPTTT